jgi:hypothetical protein
MWHENRRHCLAVISTFICIFTLASLSLAVPAMGSDEGAVKAQPGSGNGVPPTAAGIAFVEGSDTQIVVEHEGKKYLVDVAHHEIKEMAGSEPTQTNPQASSSPQTSGSQKTGGLAAQSAGPAAEAASKKKDTVYRAGDDLVFDVPTGRRVERHGLYIDFTHRFPYEPAFTTSGRGNTLLGLDDFAVPSFGFRYGLTSRLYAFAYRSPSIVGRPIELMLGYNFLDEHDGSPLNLAARFSVDGQNNFQRNFAENFELIASRSIGRRAQLYAVPTFTIHARPLLQDNNPLAFAIPEQPCSAPMASGISGGLNLKPCANTISLGLAASVDIRKTVAVVAEVTPTLLNASDLGIHRPEFAFGIQKKIWRHAFTLGFGNGPATIVSQRAATDATFLGNSSADKPSKVFIGFDLSRQVF